MSEHLIELGVGGRVFVNMDDLESHGLVYVGFEDTNDPDQDGVATMTVDEVWALIAALQEVTA